MSKVTNKNAGNKKSGGTPLAVIRAAGTLAQNKTVQNVVGSKLADNKFSSDPKALVNNVQDMVGKNNTKIAEGINNLQNQVLKNNNTGNTLLGKLYTLPGKLNDKHTPTQGSLLKKIKTTTEEDHIKNVDAIPKASKQETIKEDETILQKKMNRGPKPFIENYEDSFYIAVAIALKSILRYIWEFIVIVVKSTYKLFSDLILTPIFIFLPYLFDVTAVVLVTILIILVILYFVSGGSKRQPNNMFDNILNGFKGLVFPKIDVYDKNSTDKYTEEVTGIFGKIANFFKSIGDAINENIIKNILRLFIINPTLEDLSEDNKHMRNFKAEGRCNNSDLIESTDGRYCYKKLNKKYIDFNGKKINYKLLERSDMKDKNQDVHFDYYVPACKNSNLFRKEFIESRTDNKRTKFICSLR